MSGFSQFDTYYYNHPSPRIGGMIAFTLAKTKSDTLNLEAGAGGWFNETALVRHESLKDLQDYLLKSHSDDIYYRGQSKRHSCVCREKLPGLQEVLPHVKELTIKHDSLFPSQFRSIIKSGHCDWRSFSKRSILQQLRHAFRAIALSKNEALRNLLAAVLSEELPFIAVKIALAEKGLAHLVLENINFEHSNIPRNLLKLVSIAQHYELPTTMVDITSSLDVASWFATHSWTDGCPYAEGEGVIYRFDKNLIRRIIQKELHESFVPKIAQMEACALYGISDIRDMDIAYGARPKAQHGGSIFGLENSLLYLTMNIANFKTQYNSGDAFSAHVFPIRKDAATSLGLSKNDLAPPGDSVQQVFSRPAFGYEGDLTVTEIQTFLREETADGPSVDRLVHMMSMKLL